MEVLLAFVFTVAIAGITAVVWYHAGKEQGFREAERALAEALPYHKISLHKYRNGTPEQERGSDDTG